MPVVCDSDVPGFTSNGLWRGGKNKPFLWLGNGIRLRARFELWLFFIRASLEEAFLSLSPVTNLEGERWILGVCPSKGDRAGLPVSSGYG
jgi:hypothetical protein